MSYLTDIYHATNFEAGHDPCCSFGAGADCDCSERRVVMLTMRHDCPHDTVGEIYCDHWPEEFLDEAKADARKRQDQPGTIYKYRLRHIKEAHAQGWREQRDHIDAAADAANDYHPMA